MLDEEKYGGIKRLTYDVIPSSYIRADFQHIYFTSIEEVKVGDFVLIKEPQGLVVCKVDNPKNFNRDPKIIAATDHFLGVPSIPEKWVRDIYVPSNGKIKYTKLIQEEKGICSCGKSDYGYECSGNCTAEEYAKSFTIKLKLTLTNSVIILKESIRSIDEHYYFNDVPVSTDQELEDAANTYMMKEFPKSIDIGWADGEEAFKAGAEWQKKRS